MATYQTNIKDAVQLVGLDRDNIQNDVLNAAIAYANLEGKKIWDAWPWDNTKIDEFSAPTPDSSGIITFASTVDVVRAIRKLDASSNDGGPIYNQDEVLAAVQGRTVLTDRFENLADDSSANRRIRVQLPATAGTVTYKVLALKRFVPMTSSTYTTLSFPVDRAEGALIEALADKLREYLGRPKLGNAQTALNIALDRENSLSQREIRMVPRSPMFGDVGAWRNDR